MPNKLKVGWFSFSCCEDSTILFTELLNDHYREWKQVIDFKSALVLQNKEDLSQGLDVAFIEGAIASGKQEEKVKHLREISKKVAAVGACACTGMPSAQRNLFTDETMKEIQDVIIRFSYAQKVKKLSDVIAVDDQIPGCPMNEETFLQVLTKYLREFGIAGQEIGATS